MLAQCLLGNDYVVLEEITFFFFCLKYSSIRAMMPLAQMQAGAIGCNGYCAAKVLASPCPNPNASVASPTQEELILRELPLRFESRLCSISGKKMSRGPFLGLCQGKDLKGLMVGLRERESASVPCASSLLP